MKSDRLDTHTKSLRLNLDEGIYGTIAEIGAGQEVAHWFFRVGGAAGMVAKTMSAYDTQVSDEIYGKSERYVSRDRLEKMLDREYDLLLRRLQNARGKRTAFFVFANTISARNFEDTNICHGWVGIRFQATPDGEENNIIAHIHLNDETNLQQQVAVGIFGINLIYGACYQRSSPKSFLKGLLDDLSIERVEVDYLELNGPAFEGHAMRSVQDKRILGLSLIDNQIARAILFSKDGEFDEPMALLYKRPALILRGAFRVVKPVHRTMLSRGLKELKNETSGSKRSPVGLFEVSTQSLLQDHSLDDGIVLSRIERLLEEEHAVLLTSYPHTYHLTGYLRRYTDQPLRFSMGITNMVYHFSEVYYRDLEGGIMEATGRLIARNVRLYVSPMPVERLRERLEETGFGADTWQLPRNGQACVENIRPLGALGHLYDYLVASGAILPMEK